MHTLYVCWQSCIIKEKGRLEIIEGFKNKSDHRNLEAIKKNTKNFHCRRKTVKKNKI